MSDSDMSPTAMDMAAASLQADSQDIHTFFEVLGAKLSTSLGQSLVIEQEGGLFNKNKGKTKSLTVFVGDNTLKATNLKGRIECRKTHAVRGIVLSSEELPLAEWLKQLMAALQNEAQNSSAARSALENLLT